MSQLPSREASHNSDSCSARTAPGHAETDEPGGAGAADGRCSGMARSEAPLGSLAPGFPAQLPAAPGAPPGAFSPRKPVAAPSSIRAADRAAGWTPSTPRPSVNPAPPACVPVEEPATYWSDQALQRPVP